MSRCTYVFLDESGNLDFSTKGSRYYLLTSVIMRRPFSIYGPLDAYKHDCIEYGLDNEFFHCAHDNSHVRRAVFDRIAHFLDDMRVDILVVEKRKTGTAMRDDRRFYPEMLGHLLKYLLPQEVSAGAAKIVVITDKLPVNRKRRAIEKGLRHTLARMLPRGMEYRVLHHESRSHYGLQVADYCCWAAFRRWERGETTYYDRIRAAVRSEFDIFRQGKTFYY